MRLSTSSVFKWPERGKVDRAARAWAAEVIDCRPEVLRIGYFGSHATGSWGVGSDLDLTVVVGACPEHFECRALAWDTTPVPVLVDLLVYTQEELDRLSTGGGRFSRVLRDELVWVAPREES